jgi:heme/copper-type cytochrome/quinol oxidase subunit 4
MGEPLIAAAPVGGCNDGMEEIEPPTEQVQEEIHHRAHESRERWVSYVALSSALIAALAAVCALLAGHHANEGMIEQLQASDQWAYYQAKGIEARVLEVEQNLLAAQGKPANEAHAAKLHEYKEKRAESSKEAAEKQESARQHMARHVIFAQGVTMFQIAIAVAAISVLTRRTRFWYVGLAFAAVGIFFLLHGWLFPHLFEAARGAGPVMG